MSDEDFCLTHGRDHMRSDQGPIPYCAACNAENDVLPGEGETRTVVRTQVRVGCGQCGERAVNRHTYLLPGARRNRASAAYGKDDISWCSDHEEFTCTACQRPKADGYEWCSTFSVAPGKHQFAHMFLRWTEREIVNPAKAA